MLARLVIAAVALMAGLELGRAEWHDAEIGEASKGGMFGMARGKYGPIIFRCWDDRSGSGGYWISEVIWLTNIRENPNSPIGKQLIPGRIIMDDDFFSQMNYRMMLFPSSNGGPRYIAYRSIHSNFESVRRLFEGLSATQRVVEIRIGEQSAKYSADGLADAVDKMLADCGIKAERYDG